MLSESTINELRQILKEDYGLDLSREDTIEVSHALTGYYELVLKICARKTPPDPQKLKLPNKAIDT